MTTTKTKNQETQDAPAKPKPKYSQDELLVVFDELMFSGEYQETLTIRGKLKITFKSRSAEDVADISRSLDSGTYKLITTLQEQRALLNIACSLVNYNGKDFSEAKIEDKTKFISKLPAALIAVLSDKLMEFDLKVEAACSEGEENF